MTKKGDTYECKSCGIEVVCSSGCECNVCELLCCGKPMKNVKKSSRKKK